MAKPCGSFESLRDFFQRGYDSGATFQNEEYTFSEDEWGYVHSRTGITVWADPLDLREDGEDDEAEVFFHFTSPLGYHNITNESKEKVEVWASLITEGAGANAYWGKGVYTVPKAPHEWADREQILDNNYRSMMKRDLEQHGKDFVDREYLPRVAFCIPIICHPDMAYDVSIRQTPEMKLAGKPPGENLAGILLNQPGKPERTCVVVIKAVKSQSKFGTQRSRLLFGRRNRQTGGLNASGNLLERVSLRAQVVMQSDSESVEAMRTQFRLAVVLTESGNYREALQVLKAEVKRRRFILGEGHLDTIRATWRFSQILMHLGHFRDAQDCLLDILRNLPKSSKSKGFEREHLRSLSSLGTIFQLQHKMKYAEPLFLEAYTGCRSILGPKHFDTLSSEQDLAAVWTSLRKHQQAEDCYNEAQNELKQQLGKTHPACLKCQLDLAETMGLHRKYNDSIELYKTALESMRNQLGAQHPKTKATTASYITVLCEGLRIKTACRAWAQQVQLGGLMDQLPLLFMICFQFSKALGVVGPLLLSFLSLFCYPAAWLLAEKAAGRSWDQGWLLSFLPLWSLTIIPAVLILVAGRARGKVAGRAGQFARGINQSDRVFLQVLVALWASSLLWALHRDGYFEVFPPVLVSPWLLLELHWLQACFWAWLCGQISVCSLAEDVFLCCCRAWSALYFVGWPEPFGPWTALFCPALLIVLVYLQHILGDCIAKGVATPLRFAIEVSMSPELRWTVCKLLLALLSSILLMNYTDHAEQADSALTAVPLLALSAAPPAALLLLVKLHTAWRMLKRGRESSWHHKWLN